MQPKRIVLAITGASGAVYPRRLLQCLVDADVEVHLVISPYGKRLLVEELDIKPTVDALLGSYPPQVVQHPYDDVGSRLASGSFLTDGMVVCPCSSNTLGEIAAGLGDNLISRAAAVTLKEARRLILVTRESPMSQIELENCLRVARSGGIICPASPGFYLKPKTVEDLVDFVVGKILDLIAVEHDLDTRWEGSS